MIKRTPQEIADFFGCYVAQDTTGYWFVYENKPRPSAIYKLWNCSTGDRSCILSRLIDVPFNHDWRCLYEPQSGNQGKTEEDFPNHISEVYTHKEYKIIADNDPHKLINKVTKRLNEGWKPQGGVAVEHLPISDGYVDDVAIFYQAMVRGV